MSLAASDNLLVDFKLPRDYPKDMKEGIAHQLFLFFGVLSLLFGVFGAVRLGVNSFAFEKYPMDGVIPFNILMGNSMSYPPYQKESNCIIAPYPIYAPDGSIRPSTSEEEEANRASEKRCLKSIAEDRTRARNNDIGQVFLLLLVGAGFLYARRRII